MEKNNVKSNQMLLESIDPLNMAPEQNSTSHILNALNDDCFREIFQYFDVMDLVKTSRVCVRFNQHAKEEFDRKYKNFTLELPLLSQRWVDEDEYENILKNFGPGIRSLQIHFSNFFDKKIKESILLIVSKYCTKLTDLKLYHFDGESLEECQPLFSRLGKLFLFNCRHDINSILAKCIELKVIKIIGCSIDRELIQRKLPILEEAYFEFNLGLRLSMLSEFIEKSSTLKKLSIFNRDFDRKSIPQLIAAIGQLRELKLLEISFGRFSIAPLVKTLVDNKLPIEHLSLTQGENNNFHEVMDSLAKMQQIKILELDGTFDDLTDNNLSQFAKALPNLEEIRLRNRITANGLKEMVRHANKLSVLHVSFFKYEEIDVDDYIAMVKTFQGRRNKINISIYIHNRHGVLIIPEQIVTENHDIKFTKYKFPMITF